MDFLVFCERIGIPVTLLLGLAYVIWQILQWVAKEVVKPITASHIALVNSTMATNETQAATMKKVAEILEIKSQKLDNIEDQSTKILAIAQKSHDILSNK